MTAFVRPTWEPLRLPTELQTFAHATGHVWERRDPASDELVASVRSSESTDVDAAVESARAAFADRRWASEGARRARVLGRFASALGADRERLPALLTREQGKTIHEARIEVAAAVDLIDYYAGLARTVSGRSMVHGSFVQSVVLREPVGVVAVVTPWNWPLLLLLRTLAPALAAGNACVVKPAKLTSAIALTALELLGRDEELPDGTVACVLGDGASVGQQLVEHEGVGMVAFTGSTVTGVDILSRSAPRLRPVVLELGGKSPQIVCADADLDAVIAGIGSGLFTTTGQICTAGSRLLVDERVRDDLLERLVATAGALRLGDGLDPFTQLGPVVSAEQRRSVVDYVAIGKQDGEILAGSDDGRLPLGGHFVAPTIVAGLPRDSRLLREEIFGPVLTVQSFADEGEAIAIANDSDYGLAAGLWTRDLARAWRISRALEVGTVWVNAYQRFYHEMESSAYKASGIGTTLGPSALESFTRLKHVNFHGDSEGGST